MRLVRLVAAGFSISLRAQLAFRANLGFNLLLSVATIVSWIAALAVVFSQTHSLGGWSFGRAIVLLGTFQIMTGLLSTFIEPNVASLGEEQVKKGKLDEVLVKPAPSIFLVSLGLAAPFALLEVATGAAVVGLGLGTIGGPLPPGHVAAWLLLLATGITVTWASRVLLGSIALWSPGTDLGIAFNSMWQFGGYPVSIYGRPIRFVLTYVLTVAFISTVPARALTRGAGPVLLIVAVAVAGGSVLVVRLVWTAGLRRYRSATS